MKKLLLKSTTLILIVSTMMIGWGQSKKKLVLGEQPVFNVLKTSESITVDGKMDEAIWQKTEARKIEYFYNTEKPDDDQKTIYRMLWDDENLYAFFQCSDKYLTARETKRDGQPYFDDCAEIFLIPAADSLDTHFGLELNLYKASNDFIYFNDYYDGKDAVFKTFDPTFEVEVTFDGTLNDNSDIDTGWTMEFKIPLGELGALAEIVPVQTGNQWAFLAIRQDRNDAEGNRRSTATLFPIYDISKNVHQANRFGWMKFVE